MGEYKHTEYNLNFLLLSILFGIIAMIVNPFQDISGWLEFLLIGTLTGCILCFVLYLIITKECKYVGKKYEKTFQPSKTIESKPKWEEVPEVPE